MEIKEKQTLGNLRDENRIHQVKLEAEECCVEYTLKWLKQKHEERENDKRR